MNVPHTRPGVWPEAAGARITGFVRTDSPDGARVALLGLPDDTGIRLNRGRPGAAEGPGAFRAALARYGSPFDLRAGKTLDVPVFDAGDVAPAEGPDPDALLETHERVRLAVRSLHEAAFVPVCVGGGHDLTLPAVQALSEHAGGGHGPVPLWGLSVDAHLDVRPRIGSGMPFRRLIEGGFLDPERFVVFGAGRFVHEREHVAWLRDAGASIVEVLEAREGQAVVDRAFQRVLGRTLSDGAGAVEVAVSAAAPHTGFVTIDLDALDGAVAPGVSAVNPMGLDVSLVASVAERAGRMNSVRHFDLMELSPPHDVDGRTARVSALLFLHFLGGFQERGV